MNLQPSVEKLDIAIRNLCDAAAKIKSSPSVDSSVLQKANACVDVINSSLTLSMPTRPDEIPPTSSPTIQNCRRLNELLHCIPNFLLELISDVPLLVIDDKKYWYGCILHSVYLCFRSLIRVHKILQVGMDYYHNLLRCTADCLTNMNIHDKKTDVVLLLLLRITYACMAGLPLDTLEVSTMTNALVPYFQHATTAVQISARNAAQFLIPVLDDSQKCFFNLSSRNTNDLVNASGKGMPISSLLKLFLAYGQLPSNCTVFLQEGIFLYALSIMFQSSRDDEKQLAFSVVKMLSLHQNMSISEEPATDTQCTNIKETESTIVADSSMSLSYILSQLGSETQCFISICSQTNAKGKEMFERYRAILKQLEEYIVSTNNSDHQGSEDVTSPLMNITIDLLEGLIITDENQLIKFANLMLLEFWQLLKRLEKITEKSFHLQQVSCAVDKILITAATFLGKRRMDKIRFMSVHLCFDILMDILYGAIAFELDKETLPLTTIKKCLTDLKVLSYPPLKVQGQILLCFLVTETDCELFRELCVEEKFMADFIQQVGLCDDINELSVALRKLNSLAIIPGNRTLLRRHKLLSILERFSEKHAGTDIEGLSAELICTLLSDPPDEVEEEKPDLLNIFEKFMTACFKDNAIPESHVDGIKELIATTTINTMSDHDVPQIIVQHATCLYQVMATSHNEFYRVLYSKFPTDVTYLVNAAKILKELNIIYDDDEQLDEMTTTIFEKQVVFASKKYLPELACVSFKAMKDGYLDSWSDLDREVYFNSLMPYLLYLNFAIEQWSRMNFSVKNVLVNYGAFHLLLNELHTAPTAKIITDDIVYSVLTALYNVLLDPELAKRFRIAKTQKLLNYFIVKEDIGIRCLTQFCTSCMYMLLSRSELSEVSLPSVETDMLARCLNGVDPFFGGHENLIVTIGNLARNPKNWQVFVTAGIASTLTALALDRTSALNRILRALLNMIPEPEIFNVHANKQPTTVLPLTNPVTALLTADVAFMELIRNSHEELCKGLVLLLCPPDLKKSDLNNIQILYNLQRYADCFIFCEYYIASVGDDSIDKKRAQLYQAKSMYYDYNRELMERIEQSNIMPGFEYKNMMRKFCKKRILQVVNTLTKLKEETLLQSSASNELIVANQKAFFNELYDDEAAYMLDKALLDFLIFNTDEVSTCLLCHNRTRKLIHSHYIPKAILQEFVKAMGLEPGASVFIFSPTDHPSDWHFKSAAKATFSMLCKTCDGTVLSKDENSFKAKFFNVIYQPKFPGSHLQEHFLSYTQYLYMFATGLVFRNMAPLYSGIGAEIGEFSQLHRLMQSCREAIFNLPSSQIRPKIYILALPLQLPSMFPKVSGWDKFVLMTNSPYSAYKLLQPGEPMVPKRLYCFMVKIGIMVFVTSLDEELDAELEKICPFSQIQFSNEDTTHDFIMNIPDDQERGKYIPQKLWWSFLGWAKKEINASFSVALSVKPPAQLSGKFQAGLLVKDLLESKDSEVQPVTANLLPPGYELNFDKHGTLPEEVIVVPSGQVVLLHYSFKTSSGAQGYAVLGKQEPSRSRSNVTQPYLLVYLQDIGKKFIVKTGFCIDQTSMNITGTLRGTPTTMNDSLELKELIEQVPDIVHDMLRAKGFRSLKSLLFWQQSFTNFFTGNDNNKIALSLDTRCINEKCIYCDMRCDVCLQPCLDRFKIMRFPTLGEVHCCTELCSESLLTGSMKGTILHKREESVVQKGHKEIICGYFTIDDLQYPGLKTAVQFIVSQTTEDITGLYSIPCGSKYIVLWHRSIYKPTCIEYMIDDNFNAIEMLNLQESGRIFSREEEREMMNQLHYMLVRIGIPYHFNALQFHD